MKRKNGYDNSSELNLGGNVNDFVKSEDYPNQAPNFSNYYEFFTQNSSLDQKAPTHVFDSISVPPSTSIPAISEFQTQLMFNNPGLLSASSLDIDACKSNPYFYNCNNHQALPLLKCTEQYDEVDPLNQFTSSQNQIQTQSYSSLAQEASGATANVSLSRPRKRLPAPVVHNVTRQRVSLTDRKRKEKIAEKVKALQELLPQSVEGSQAVVMDKIIEYVNYLKLQMKELSECKLVVDFPSCPFIFNEGDRHYRFHGKTTNESLEETLAKLLKMDKSAAIKFFQSKGLYVMRMALAHSLA